MHPVSTALFLLGYGLALPIGLKMTAVVARQHRLAFAGHQIGVAVAFLGWLIRGSYSIAIIHAVWLIGARIWFQLGREPSQRDGSIA